MSTITKKKPVLEKKVASATRATTEDFPMAMSNYKWMIIGFVAMVVGFFLMSGGGTEDPTQFAGDTLFSTMRLTVAPIVILAGLILVLYSIMKKGKEA